MDFYKYTYGCQPLLTEWFFYVQNLNNITLNTNPHCFTYQIDELLIELLGGIATSPIFRPREIRVPPSSRNPPKIHLHVASL